MIRDRQIFRGFIAHYIGSPTVNFYLDGSGSPTQTIQLPNNASYSTRLITANAGVIGYVFKLDSNSEFEIDLEPVLEPTNNYTSLTYWDYYELTFEGTINVAIYVDNTTTPVIASTTLNANFGQDTQKVYFPANTFGWVPYLWAVEHHNGITYSSCISTGLYVTQLDIDIPYLGMNILV